MHGVIGTPHRMHRMMVTASAAFAALVLLGAPAAAQVTVFRAALTGAQAAPPTQSPATGFITVTLDQALNTLTVDEIFSGLTGGLASAAHIHCCALPGTAAIVAVPFTGFPATMSGTYGQVFDLSSLAAYNPVFVTSNGGTAASARAALIAGMFAGQTYANIHNATYPAGEISGQLIATPEPASIILFGTGLALLGVARRRRV